MYYRIYSTPLYARAYIIKRKEIDEMNRFSRRLGVYLPALILFSIVSVVLRSIACFLHLDYSTGYFNPKILITIADVLATAGAVFLFSYIVTAKRTSLVPSFSSPATYIPSGMICAALLFLSADSFSSLKRGDFSLTIRSILKSPSKILLLLSAVLALICIVNFFLTVLLSKKESEARAAFGIVVTIFLCIYAAYLYFDSKLPLNAPCKIVDEMAFLFSALFFCYETRLSLGREKWRSYVCFGLIASLLTAYSSIPTLILYFFGGVMISDSLTGAVLALTLCIYVTARTVLVGFLMKDEKSETVAALMAYHKMREDDLKLPTYARAERGPGNSEIGSNYSMDIPLPMVSEGEEALPESEDAEIG